MQAVRDAAKLLAPGADELPFLIENDHRVRDLAIGEHSVVDVDVVLGVFDDTVCVAVLDVGRKLAPVVNGLVLPFAFTKNVAASAGLVLSTKEQGHGKS